MHIVLAVCICCLGFTNALAQSQPDSLHAAQLLEEADVLSGSEKYKRSDNKALEAIEEFEQLGDWANFTEGYRLIFYNGYYSGGYSDAISLLQAGLKKVPKSAFVARAKIQYYLGFSLEKIGEVFSSLKVYESSAIAFEAVRDTSWLIPLFGNLGAGYTQTGDYLKAIYFLKQAISMEKGNTSSTSLWKNHKLLGQAYFSYGDWKRAMAAFDEAQQLRDPLDGSFEAFDAYIYLELGKTDTAFRLAQKALFSAKKEHGSSSEAAIAVEKLLGDIYLASGKPEQALATYQRVLPFYKKAPNKRSLGRLYVYMADAQRALHKYEQAINTYLDAQSLFLPDLMGRKVSPEMFREAYFRPEVWLMETYRGMGHCYVGKYKNSRQEKWLEEAEGNFVSAIGLIEVIKLNYDESGSKLSMGSYTHPFYEDLIQTEWQFFEKNGDPSYLEEAFLTAQKANAFVLREQLSEQQALELAGVSQDTLDALERFRSETALLFQEIDQSTSSNADSLQQRLFYFRREETKMREAMEKAYPLFNELRNDLKVPGSQAIQAQLDSTSLLVKYFLGEHTLYIFSISQKTFHLDTVQLPANFQSLVSQYRRSVSDLDFVKDSSQIAEQQYLHAAHQLFLLLLKKPLARHDASIRRLTIVADGILNAISFQALLMRPSDSWTNATKLVVAKYAISYSYFCNMLALAKTPSNPKGDFMSFGLEFDDFTLKYLQSLSKDSITNKAIKDNLRSGSLSKLPFSDDEARDLARLMGGKSWLNEQATKAHFLAHTPAAQVIHLATHSILDTEKPHLSALIFTKTKDSLDNLLRLYDIYNLQLDADMIVLSACNTAYGQQATGEGMNSLARAFHVAGIPSVMATMWSISDEASKHVVELYYQFLKKGMSKDIALQQAQLAYLQDDAISSPAFRMPIYWAAWMPIGDVEAIYSPEGWRGYYVIGGIFLVLLLGLGWRFFPKVKI